MTLQEKVGQLVQLHAPQVPDLAERIRAGRVGSIFGIIDPVAIEDFQRIAMQHSRLGIPLIVGNDVIHGYRTVFPIPLAEACTWNPTLVERAAATAAREARANGTDWIFAPMVDICRDPRWGRIAEGSGEDPYLGSLMAAARVAGFQSDDGIAACPKHYVAYGAAEAGKDYNSVDISAHTLRDVYLPPFKAAFEAGARTVMSAFNEIDGVPSSANPFTLRTILRDEWGWSGLVVSDYNAILELIEHGFAADLKDAARLAMLAGVDMDMMSSAYDRHLAELVAEGNVSLERLDEAVGRVLELKVQLGLFERTSIDPVAAERAVLTDAAKELALEVARQSLVLLKNDGDLLPLSRPARLAVVGPLADAPAHMLGCWAPMGRAQDVETVLDGLRTSVELEAAHISLSEDPAAGVEAAQGSDVTLVVVGEPAALSGEAHSRAHLGLPGQQQELLDALARTGKPLVVVLITGRPLAIPRLAHQATALLLAWHPGIRAGQAVADVLFGTVPPSGRLVASFPRAEGQIPIYYAHKNTGRPAAGQGTLQFDARHRSNYLDESNAPLFPFGFGLTYTVFEYSELRIENPVVEELVASATVTNAGSRPGTEVVQLYVRDLVGSLTRPVRELKAFARVDLQAGESRSVRFTVPVERLGFTGADMRYRVERGDFKLWIGPDAQRGLEGAFSPDR